MKVTSEALERLGVRFVRESSGIAEYTLTSNGLKILFLEHHLAPVVTTMIMYRVGSRNEGVGFTGSTHFLEHMMFKSTHEHDSAKGTGFVDMLKPTGADYNAYTGADSTSYVICLPKEKLGLALALEADRMRNLKLRDDERESEMTVVRNEFEIGENDIDDVMYKQLMAIAYAEHPYHHPIIGWRDDVEQVPLARMQEFYDTFYHPNNATLVIAGDFNRDSVVTWVNRYFGGIPRGPQMPARPVVPAFTVARDTFLVQEDKVTLPRLYKTWHSVKLFHPDDAALDVLADVLAGDKNSRLYKRLVFDMQVAQDVNAFQSSGMLDGFFQITVTPKPGQTPAKMAELVQEELEKIQRDGPTPRELARSLNTRRANFLDQLASVLGKADRLASYDYMAGTPDYAQQDLARYERVTAADVQRVANTYLKQHAVVLTVVPEGKRQLMVTGGAK